MKRFSTSFDIREVQNKITAWHYYTSIRRVKHTKKQTKTDKTKHWWRYGATGTLIHCWWDCKNDTATLENSLTAHYKLNIHFACDPVITLLGIYPREIKIYVCTKTCVQGFLGSPVVKDLPCNAGTLVWSLSRDNPTCCMATKPTHGNYWTCIP